MESDNQKGQVEGFDWYQGKTSELKKGDIVLKKCIHNTLSRPIYTSTYKDPNLMRGKFLEIL